MLGRRKSMEPFRATDPYPHMERSILFNPFSA